MKKGRGDKVMIFYFTGTGNSLYVAKAIEDNPISIPQIVNKTEQVYKADKIGIVSPIYGHEVPEMVKRFLKTAKFQTDYFYIILTFGNRHGGAVELTANFCEEYGIKVNYLNLIEMVDNWLPTFDMDKQKKIDKKVDTHLSEIIKDIQSGKSYIQPVTDTDREAHKQYLENISKMPADIFQHLYIVNEDCIQCEICTKVCPAGCISLQNSNIVYDMKNCQICMSCIHNCPKKAIQLNIPEKNRQARYRNENVKLQEIIEANIQR